MKQSPEGERITKGDNNLVKEEVSRQVVYILVPLVYLVKYRSTPALESCSSQFEHVDVVE